MSITNIKVVIGSQLTTVMKAKVWYLDVSREKPLIMGTKC